MSAPNAVTRKDINPLLAKYLASLAARPLLTKAVTAGALSFVQEVLANHLAGVNLPAPKSANPLRSFTAAAKIDSRAFKLALYGFFISAPLGHYAVGSLQKFFEGKNGPSARFLLLLGNNLFVAPLQTAAYLTSMAVIGGARSSSQILAVLKSKFFPVLKMTWAISPIAVLTAQKFLPPETWVIFFNLVSFVMGTNLNTAIKKQKLKALAEEQAKKEREAKEKGGSGVESTRV
ncbi:uncharacterized protein EI90DRAFT_3144475 [Cantharellus anzutake]|uniref:uncharacterized protein n=1 Tax=Cantharellus anzutake TaxID=1750568 RepID=UPI00190853CF|nr:uncharacterized protein EI90DRAFT_3144475 [Cantharellus anzutake]KAF8337415.1 hypothetical protein EI90DRAFT_3144475 [Cantharellus anzutake]